ncbi:uncharacterized protein LOC130892582 [Diorhabda carinulata]|uniref:uncharacterized protein LOC130892582 n=1 Tax=Diorhabda carinulata TaxID=1163345 RepID=UPI00259FE13E|nr:uncharacterized protein LOC130892582 [Diorhabda carinulata]
MEALEEAALLADPLILAERKVDPANPNKIDELFENEFLYREMSYYIARLEQYENALIYFNRAISQKPNNIRTLLGRSKSRAEACYYVGALADTYRAYKLDPDNLIVAAQRGLNLYFMAEFEEALIHNLRHLPYRQKPAVFADGVRHCSIALENTVGEFAGNPLRDYFRIIRKIAWIKNFIQNRPYEPTPKKKKVKKINIGKLIFRNKDKKVNEDKENEIRDSLEDKRDIYNISIPPFNQEYPFGPLQRYTTNIENFMAEKYLESMYREKIFLKGISKMHGISTPNEKGTQKIKDLAKKAFDVVNFKQELLRTSRPFYHLKYQEEKCTTNVERRLKQEQFLIQQNYKKEAESLLNKVMLANETRNLHKILAACDQLNNFCQKKSKKYLPDRNIYLAEVYKMVGQAFYSLLRLNPSQFKWDQEKRILLSFGLPISRTPSGDSMLENYKPIYVDVRKRISIYEARAEQTETPEEVCWVNHELARLYILTKRYDDARLPAFNCLRQSSKDPELFRWNVNASILMAKINIAEKIKADARFNINNAIDVATSHHSTEAIEYLRLCLEVIDKIEFDEGGTRVLEKRKMNIMRLMQSDKMKEEFQQIFSKMNGQRTHRRLTISGQSLDYNQRRRTVSSIVSTQKRLRKSGSDNLRLKKTISVSEYLDNI